MTYLFHNNLHALTPQNRRRHRSVARATFGRRLPRWLSPTSGENFPAVVDVVFGTVLDLLGGGLAAGQRSQSLFHGTDDGLLRRRRTPLSLRSRARQLHGWHCPVGIIRSRNVPNARRLRP
jgi:hypothetical protein